MPSLSVTVWTAIASGALCAVLVAVVAVFARVSSRREAAENRHSGQTWMLRAPLLPLVVAVVAGLLAIYSLILHFAFGATDFHLPDAANVTSPVLVAASSLLL